MSVTVGKTTEYKLRDVRSGLSEYGVRLSCALRSVGRVGSLYWGGDADALLDYGRHVEYITVNYQHRNERGNV